MRLFYRRVGPTPDKSDYRTSSFGATERHVRDRERGSGRMVADSNIGPVSAATLWAHLLCTKAAVVGKAETSDRPIADPRDSPETDASKAGFPAIAVPGDAARMVSPPLFPTDLR
jgi:hypothetical protein